MRNIERFHYLIKEGYFKIKNPSFRFSDFILGAHQINLSDRLTNKRDFFTSYMILSLSEIDLSSIYECSRFILNVDFKEDRIVITTENGSKEYPSIIYDHCILEYSTSSRILILLRD